MFGVDVPWAHLKLKGCIRHDVDTSRTFDTGGLQPSQTLNTHGTVIGDRAKSLRDGHCRRCTRVLTEVDLTRVIPVGSGAKNDRWGQGVAADTKPHVTGVGKSTNGVQVVVGDDAGSQGVESEIARILDGTRHDRDRGSQAIGRGDVEATLVIQRAPKGGEGVVHNGVVHSGIDGETADLHINGTHVHGIFGDGQCPYRREVEGCNEASTKVKPVHVEQVGLEL